MVLSATAQKLLARQLQEHESEWVFLNPDGSPFSRHYLSHRFRRAARAAGLKDFHFHDLRHHGATMAFNKGLTVPIRYAAVTDTTLRAAAEVVSGNEP